MKKREVLTVYVVLDGFYEVHSEKADITMIPFHGTFESEFLSGEIIPGGTDTQIELKGKTRTLSARYILKGETEGETKYIFVENNGEITDGEINTRPRIFTDCDQLKYLENADLSGTVEGDGEGKVRIHIYENIIH